MMKQAQKMKQSAGGRTRTHGNARRALLCCTALLSLGLAACNTTGGGGAGGPGGTGNGGSPAATSELGKAQAAAKTAAEAAKMKSDAAAVEAAKAEAALAGLVALQTGNAMSKEHAEAARAAAAAAMAAYETAKAEADKAAAATTVTAAVEARSRAQAALETAEEQNGIAMAKAAAAVEAAGLEVKVSHDDDGRATYRVGDVTIVAGSPKTTVETDGRTTVTGKIRDWKAASGIGQRAAVTYRAASGETPERRAQPAVAARRLVTGSITDSADDSMRLHLIDKYVTEDTDTTVGIYKTDTSPSYTWGYEETLTEATPYGTFNSGGNAYVIKRADGVFYRATGPAGQPRAKPGDGGTTAANEYTIAAGAQPENTGVENGIYYYDDVNGNRTWLKREGLYTEESPLQGSNNTGIRYEYISALENVRFPQARPFEHLNYGIWAGLKEDGDTLADLGTGFVVTLPDGSVTPADDMPNFGSATYRGQWVGNVRAAAADGDGAFTTWTNGMTTTADFADNTLTTTLPGLATFEGDIDGNGFSGADVSGVGTTGGLTGGDGDYTGSFSGNFFGPEFEEVGGVFDITSEGGKAGEARGAFGGRRDGTIE